MNSRTESQVDKIATEARGRYLHLVNAARSQTEQAAGKVRDGKKPVQTLSKLGLELSSISHRATSRVLKNQTRMVENQIDALAGRLHTAARAGSIRDLVRSQIRLIPQDASRFVEDTRQTFSVVAEAGSEVRNLFAGTLADLRGKSAAGKKPAGKKAKPAARKKAKAKPAKVARKKASRSKKKAATKASAKPRKTTAARSATPPTASAGRTATTASETRTPETGKTS